MFLVVADAHLVALCRNLRFHFNASQHEGLLTQLLPSQGVAALLSAADKCFCRSLLLNSYRFSCLVVWLIP
jgi:hypothetical protein